MPKPDTSAFDYKGNYCFDCTNQVNSVNKQVLEVFSSMQARFLNADEAKQEELAQKIAAALAKRQNPSLEISLLDFFQRSYGFGISGARDVKALQRDTKHRFPGEVALTKLMKDQNLNCEEIRDRLVKSLTLTAQVAWKWTCKY